MNFYAPTSSLILNGHYNLDRLNTLLDGDLILADIMKLKIIFSCLNILNLF